MSSDSGSSSSAAEDQLAVVQRYHVLQAEQEGTQKRTFSNWINSQLSKHPKSTVVKDLFIDIQDGHILVDLLEVLSGEDLPREKGKNIFKARSNIESALNFLGSQSIKLINIHVEDIINGKPSIVLGLIWQIILHFHIEGLASILEGSDDQQPVKCETKNGVSPTASPSPKRSAKSRWKTSARKALLQWAQERCAQLGSVNITDFKSSWKNGMAFLAIIQSLRPDLIDMVKLQAKSNEEKLQEAFRIAENELKIPKLIEPEDLTVSDPDEKSIMTYVAQFLQYSKNMEESGSDMPARVTKAMEWLNEQELTLKELFSEMRDETYAKKYQEILLFMRKFNEQKRIFMSGLAIESLQDEEQLLIKQSLENITFQIAEWKKQLDRSLPPPLDSIETWLTEVENLMSQALPESGSHYNTMSLIQALSEAYKALMVDAKNHMASLGSFWNVDDNGVVVVPTDKTEEMKTRLEKILAAHFSVLVDYRCAGYYVLALLEEARPKLKSWKVKYKAQESVEALLADYKEFVGKQSMVLLETAFQKFRELHNLLLTTDDYSDDPEISKQYEAIELKYKAFVSSVNDAESTLEQVLTSWTHLENNMNLITAWLDEQQRIAPTNVPLDILAKWKSVHKSLNRDGNFLIERTYEKTASKISSRLKTLNNQWTRYVKQYKEQKEISNASTAKEDLYVDPNKGASKTQSDISAHSLSLYIRSLQKSGDDTRTVNMYSEILSHLEAVEKVIEAVDNWSGKAEQLLSDLDQKANTQEPLSVDIQEFYENGSSCQEQLEKAEVNMQALTQLLYNHKDLQHFDLDRWRQNVVRAQGRVQDLVSRVSLLLHPPEQSLSEEDIKRNFESSKSNLETYITKALGLLGQKVTPEEFISQYETCLSKFGSQNLEHFLKATGHMKNISSSTKEKSLVEEVSSDVRNRWKSVHDHLEAYVSELKIHKEKKKFDELICKLDKQLLKEKNSVGVVDAGELIREHEVVFADHGCLGELNQCLQMMQTLDDRLRTSSAPTMFAALITQCTKMEEELNKNAADTYFNLQSVLGKSKVDENVMSADNGMKSNLNKPHGTQEVCEADCVPQETNMANDNEPSLEMLLQRYDTEKSDLELLIQNSRDKLVAESPKEAQDVKGLQCKLHELQILLDQANRSWMEFDATSQKVQILLHGTEKKAVSEKIYAMQSSLATVSDEIKSRIQSLSITINVLLPIEEEVSVLCESSGETPIHGVEQFTISTIGSIYQNLQDVQTSVKAQIQQCHNLKSATKAVDPAGPVDVQTVQSVVLQYKTQLEATNEMMKEREDLLKELEMFLSSLAGTKMAIQAEAAVSGNDITTVLQKRKNLEKLKQKVYRLRKDAEKLDGHLEPAEIFLENPEHGELTSCQKMLDGFFEKIEIVEQSILMELRNLDSRSASGTQPLSATLNNSLQTEMEQFTVSKLDTVLQEMKDVQDTFAIEIQHLDSLDSSFTEPILKYKTELQATNEAVKERETTLKSLGTFLSSLTATKMSIEAGFPVLGMDKTTLQEKQLSLDSLEKDIYLLGQEAEKLDDCMQVTGILIEDPENGGETTCKKMISGFFEKLESAQQAVQREFHNLQETETFGQLNKRLKEFCRNIEDIQDESDKIGLQDPTIHAVQQRMKSLITLEKKLEIFDQEKKFISDAIKEFLQTSQRKDLTGCEELWEDTQQYLVHSKEQCEVIIELLRKFQHYKTTLTSLIQKVESTISHRASYIGKDNLHKMMMKVEELKRETEDHSENVEEINTICKNLQFQISKIKRVEDASFQVEANTLIDKWLDVCEKLDCYNENLKSAVCLWNKVLQLSQEMEPWTEGKIKFLESENLTSADVQLLHTELQNQEKLLEEIRNKSTEIQKLLQGLELPLELQAINTSLINKITAISTIVSEKSQNEDVSLVAAASSFPDGCPVAKELPQMTGNEDISLVAAASDCPDGCSVAKELPQMTGNEPVNGEPQAHTKAETFSMEVEPEVPLKDRPLSSSTTLVEPKRADIQKDSQEEPQGEERSEHLGELRMRLGEVQKRREKLILDLQPRLQDNVKQLASFRELLQESQNMMGILQDSVSKEPSPVSSHSSGLNGQCLEIKLLLETFTLELQDSMQILERRLEGHQQYESLSTALNNKMTSFYEELLNFSCSSRENAPCELKRQKLQALRDQYEALHSDLGQVSQLAENVKQTSSAKGITRIQEAMDMHHSKMRGYLERIDHLTQVIEQPPINEKRKGKKTKKGSKKKLEHQRSIEETSLQTTLKTEDDYLVKATVSSLVWPTGQTTVQPVVDVSVQYTVDPLVEHTVDLAVQHPVKSSVQYTEEHVLQSSGKSSVKNTGKDISYSTMGPPERSALESSVQSRVEVLVQPTMEILVQPTMTPSVQPAVGQSLHSTLDNSLQLTMATSAQPTMQPSKYHVAETSELPDVLSAQPALAPSEQTALKPSMHPTAESSMQSTLEPSVQPTEKLPVQPILELSVQSTVEQSMQCTVEQVVQPTVVLSVHPREETLVPPTADPSVPPIIEFSVQPTVQPMVQPTVLPAIELSGQPTVEPVVQPTVALFVHPTDEPSVLPTIELLVQPTVEPVVQPTVALSVHPTEEPLAPPTEEPSVLPTIELSVQPTVKPMVQPLVEPVVQPTVALFVHPTDEPSVLPTLELSVQPTVKPMVQPTVALSAHPTEEPSVPPTEEPLVLPTIKLSVQPTVQPIVQRTVEPVVQPTVAISVHPTEEPSVPPTEEQSVLPTIELSGRPTVKPMVQPTVALSVHPTEEPSAPPTEEPSVLPTMELSVQPTLQPMVQPTVEPVVQPTVALSVHPTEEPSVPPTEEPSVLPTIELSDQPTVQPALQPAVELSVQFIVDPYVQPILKLGAKNEVQDSVQRAIDSVQDPSVQPSVETVEQPTVAMHQAPVQPIDLLTPHPTEKHGDQSALKHDTRNVKEKKSSKTRKKKKVNAVSAGKQLVESKAEKEPITLMQKIDTKRHSAESADGESIHERHYVDVTDSSGEAAEEKPLEEAKAGRREASGQPQTLVQDCNSFRRQPENSVNDLTVGNNDSGHISGLITTLEEGLRRAETLSANDQKLVIPNEVQDIKSVTLAGDVPAQQLDGVQTESETLTKERQPHIAAYQQEALEIFSQVSQILGAELLQEKALEKLESKIKLWYVTGNNKLQPEKSPWEIYVEELKKNIKKFSKETIKLNVLELDQDIEEIEKLCNDPSKLQDSWLQLKTQDEDVQNSLIFPSDHDYLSKKLMELKTEKQKLRQDLMNFQNALSAARVSYQMLTKEKENLKMSSTESHQTHLDKLGHFLDKVAKEKETLSLLKAQQSNFESCMIFHQDKNEMDVDIRQLGAFWEQIELCIHREHDRLMKEAEELQFLQQKVDQLQNIIQVQQDLLDQPAPSQGDILKGSLLLSADVEAIRHLFSLLRNVCDLQMKRTWGGIECKRLECSLDNLQSSLESLEERVKDRQLTRCQTPDALLEQYPFLKLLYDSHIWLKKLQNKTTFGQAISLLPKDVEQQIATSKNVHKEILDRKSTINSVIAESKHISQAIDPAALKDICSFFQQLQELYQEQIIQSVDRLQKLESGLEKRRALFSEIEKLKELLHCLEKEATPVKRGIFTAAELCEQLNCLKAKTIELEEIEGLVLTLLRNSQSYHRELKISEQLYLNDILRCLKSKARRIWRLEENKFLHTEKLLRICNEFQERRTSLSRELSSLQPVEPKMHDNAEMQAGEGFEKKFQVSQNAISSSQVHLSDILSYKDLFEDSGLYWDGFTIDNLQNKCPSFLMHRSGHFGHNEPAKERNQELLEEAKVMCFSVQREALAAGTHFDYIETQVLSKKIRKISILAAEALRLLHEKHDSQDALHNEEPTVRALAENMDRLYQSLSQLITDFHTNEKSIQYRLEQTLCNLRRIHQELSQPCFVNLDSYKIQEQLIRLESLDEICKSELKAASIISSGGSAEEFLGQIYEIDSIGKQVENTITQHIDTIKTNFNVLQDLQHSIAKLAELFGEYEELQENPVDFNNQEDHVAFLNTQQEGINIAIADLHDVIKQLKSNCNPHDQEQLDDLVNQITSKNMLLNEMLESKQSALASYREKHLLFKGNKQKICKDLEEMETIIRDSFSQKPASYKAALAQWEKSKSMVAKVNSYEEELLQLKQAARDLSAVCGGDVSLFDKVMASLWDRWLYLLGVCKDWELHCDELKQEWKLISELMEREVILLDNCQEEILDKPEMKQKTAQLLNSVVEISRFEENVQMQQLQLSLLMCRLQNILGKPEASTETDIATVIKEIHSMDDKCEILLQKSQKNKQDINAELEDREALKGDFFPVKQSLQQISSKLENLESTDSETTRSSLQEIQDLIESQKETSKLIMEKVSARYAEHVPAELQSLVEECQEYLKDMEEKVKDRVLQSSPENIMNRKVNEIKSGLHSIEVHLTERSQNILQAKELQKKMWDEVDTWLSKLHSLEAEVQEMAEEDPCQAQEWMDKLTEPFSHYQQVTHLVEHRTANLKKAASKLEEYEDTLKITQTWIQNTDNLLNEQMKDCSAKVLNKHVVALEIALDDSEQKRHLLDSIHSELSELAPIFETETIVERFSDVRSKVLDLRQRIMKVLPEIQLVAHEVLAIEDEVKKMERTVNKIKTILTSNDIDDMTPKDHYMHGQVMLENLNHIRKTIAEIEVYRPTLPLSECGVQSLCAFRRMFVVLKEAEMLEKVIMEQNEFLEPIISEMAVLEKEHEKAQVSREESSDIKEKAEAMKKQMERLNQKKETILLAQRNSVHEQLESLSLQPQDQDMELMSPITEGMNIIHQEVQRRDSYFLPSLAEETEDSTLVVEVADDRTEVTVVKPEHEEDVTDVPVLSQGELRDAGQTLADVQPEMMLSDCQGKVAEVERWLQKVKLPPELGKQDPDMLQSVEEQLAECQKTLQETEMKINLLLEDANYRRQGNGTVLEEAETLSLKLKTLTKSLEHVQEMLQIKSISEQIHNGVKEEKLLHPLLSRSADSAETTRVFSTEMTNKKHPDEIPEQHQDIYIPSYPRSPVGDGSSTPTKPRSKTPLFVIEDITWSKWLYLQKELSYMMKATSSRLAKEPDAVKEVKISFISRIPVNTVKAPLTEESKHFLTRIKVLNEEASSPLTQESARNVHRDLFVWMCSVSQWLQNIEEMLDLDILTREEATAELTFYEKLTEDLRGLSEEMGNNTNTLLSPITHEGANTSVLSQCYGDLRDWLVQIHKTVKTRCERIQGELDAHNNYQNDIRQLYDVLVKKKTDLIKRMSNRGICEAAGLIQEAAMYEKELLSFESQVSSLNERGEKLSIPICSNQDIHKLEDVLDDTWHILRRNQDKCSSAVISKSQMDALLCGLSDMLCFGKEKIEKSKKYRSRSKEDLNAHIENHREFFSHLESQVQLLQNLSRKSNPDFDKKRMETVTQEANTLRQHSDDHCINMMVVMKNWKDFDARYDYLRTKYEALEAMIPTSSLVEESVERVTERLKQYQKIQTHIDENESRLRQIIGDGKKLQSAVTCPELDGQINKMEQQWSQLTKKVSHELHRLESLISHLTRYNKDSSELSTWLESALQRLSNSRMQSLDASQELNTIKNNLNNFFEFTNDVDQKSSLKTSVVNAGNQLLRLKECDTSVLKLSLSKFEESWTDLIGALPATQDKLQQQLVEKLPSLEAIRELMDWMKEDNEIMELQSIKNIPTTTAAIRCLLQRCKCLRREISHKQWIVDYVNQSLLQLGVGDVESKRYERTELAELLGTLNLQWNQMQGNINAKIQHFEQALENISDQESKSQTVSNWFDAQQQRAEKLHRPSSLTTAESVLAECMVLEEQLKAKSNGIEELNRNREASEDQNGSNEGVLTTEALFKKRTQVAEQVAELKTSTLLVLQHWKDYNGNYGQIERMTVKLQYVLGQSTAPSSSMNSLNARLKRLQVVQEEVEQHEENWSHLRSSLSSLKSLCNQLAVDVLEQECKDIHDRWTSAGEELSEHLQAARSLLHVWEDYNRTCLELAPHIEQVEEKSEQLLCAKLSEDRVSDTLEQRIQDLKALEQNLQGLRAHNLQVSELSDKVLRQNPAAMDVIQSERQNTSHRIAHLERRVSSKATELMSIQNKVESFKSDLDKLQSRIKSSADIVSHVCHTEKEERSEVIKKNLLELSELTSDVEHLNEEMCTLPLGDRTQMSLQNLNRMWAKTIATALEDCRQHRMIELEKNNFIQNYETWMQCLEKMENNLTEGIAGTFEALRKQQEIYERLQAEITINEHILPSFVNKALSVLEVEDEQNRNELILKLTSLKDKWQSVIRLVQQKKKEISVLLKQWWQFRVSKQSLDQQLCNIQEAVCSVNRQKCRSLTNTKKMMYDFKDKERHLKRLQPSYITTLSNCKDILPVAEPKSKAVLQQDLSKLSDLWQSTEQQLQAILTHFSGINQKNDNFECKIEDKRKSLHNLKAKVDEPLPMLHEELQMAKGPLKELEEALDEWGDSLKDLDDMKSELSQYIIAEDGIVLNNQVEALHRQWEELCLRVSMRKQEIEDRLNAWNVFNEKNKELCDWLTQMESKVLQTGDVNIEEMIEKLQKDCMEEINLFSENKLHLKQIGDQLINASNQARSKEIENKLNKVNDRWKHLFDVIGSRVKKLKETLVNIQHLYKNMSNLRTWLARIESELSKPVIYSICDDQEINKKLEEQRDLQKDIEVHSAGVASVLNICERLLHDTDACANETECDSIQQTTRSLDKRWRNICSMSMERRMRIEETCRLWQKFLEDYSRFDEWLKEAEAMAASPHSSDVLYTKAKEEQKKFEAFQRQIHERLTHLELINKQYRRLARENRTDAASRLKQMVHEGNQRWDQLQKRVTSILRRLKHFTSQREDFEGTRDCILVWLTEMDLQLTNVEHFSESDIEEKMQQLIGFKQEITLNTNKIDQLIVFGEHLIQKSEAMDAVVIEDELEEIHRYCQEVFGRVYRFHERLTSRNLNLEEERETSENDTDGEDSREIQNSSWHTTMPDVETSHQSLCHLMPPPLPHERSGRETPVSVDSIPLEWDPTVDVGGSSMHENEEDGAYYSPLSGNSDLETPSWHSPDKHVAAVNMVYNDDKKVKGLVTTTSGPSTILDQSFSAQEIISRPTGEVDSRTLNFTSEQLEVDGLQGMKSPETHSGVIERWEIIQAQTLSKEQWQHLNADLDIITLWLDNTEVELEQAKRLKPSSTIQELEQKMKMLQDILREFDKYKALVISANLNSKELQLEDDDTESKGVLNKLHMANVRWERACRERDCLRESLQSDLLQCEEFQQRSDKLLLWLTEAEDRRLQYRVMDISGNQHVLLESQKNLMQLKEQLLQRQAEANSLRDLSSSLSTSISGAGYMETEERMHVIGSKLRQLLLNVSQDLCVVQKALGISAADEVDSLTFSTTQKQTAIGTTFKDSTRTRRHQDNVQEAPKKTSFFYRVLRAAFPLQLLLLLLLFFACMIPVSEDDFSCAQANNFARSFYPMLRYTNGPPPT